MSYKLHTKELRYCIDYADNKDMMAFKDGYQKMPVVFNYLKAAAENLLEMGVDPLVPRDHRLPRIGSYKDDQQEPPVLV